MKRILFGFLLGLLLNTNFRVKAQESEIHPLDGLSMRDVIEVLADYELVHPRVPMHTDWYGWTEPDEQRIYVIANADLSVRRRTVIHELTHVSRRFKNQVAPTKEQEEQETEIVTAVLYGEWFGVVQ